MATNHSREATLLRIQLCEADCADPRVLDRTMGVLRMIDIAEMRRMSPPAAEISAGFMRCGRSADIGQVFKSRR